MPQKTLQAQLSSPKSAIQQSLTFIFVVMLEYRCDLLHFVRKTYNYMLNYILNDVNHVLPRVQAVLLTNTCCGMKSL